MSELPTSPLLPAACAAAAGPAQAAEPAPVEALVPTCPLALEVLSVNFRKHVDPKAPVPLRMMGAKGLVPMGPKELATALFMLTFDADPLVREAAQKSAEGLPDKILSSALRDESAEAVVLDFYAKTLAAKPQYLEMIVLNNGASDATVAGVAALATSERLVEIISQNQLRLLRHEGIVRALVTNPAAKPAVVDSVCDFCVRSGLILHDLAVFKAARRRVLGGAALDEEASKEAAAKHAIEQIDAEQALEQMGASGAHEGPAQDDAHSEPGADTRRQSITQQVSKLSIAKKIEWANKKGNKEVRTILLRDANKLVQMAVVQSPRITEDEISKLSLSRVLPQDVLMYIYNNRQLTKNYTIKVNLVNNPKVPAGVAMRYLSHLRTSDLKSLSKNKNISNAVANAARALAEKKSQ